MNDINRTRVIIFSIIGLIVLGVIGYFAYQYFTGAPSGTLNTGQSPVGGNVPSGGGLPSVETQQSNQNQPIPEVKPGEVVPVAAPEQTLVRITDFPVLSPSLNKTEDKILYYKKDGGDLYASDFTGKTQDKLSNITVVGMLDALWSSLRDRAAVLYLDGETMKGFLHIGTSSVAVLPQNIQSAAWSPDGKSFAYLIQKDTSANLTITDASGKNQKTIFSTPILDSRIQWATNDKFLFSTAPSGLTGGFIFAYSRLSGGFQKILGPLFGLTSLVSPDGSKILVSSTNNNGHDLTLEVHSSTGALLFTPDFITLPEKCVWISIKETYCAVPRDIPTQTLWPDDYLRGEVQTNDHIVSLDTDKQISSEIFNDQDFDIGNLVVTKDKKYLFFINRTDGSLWSLKLQQ